MRTFQDPDTRPQSRNSGQTFRTETIGKSRRRRRAARRSGFLLLIAALSGMVGSELRPALGAETNAAPLANRYLFILETSRSMASRSDGTLKALQKLLGPAMNGQLHRGDTLAIWTYNEQLHAGRFPLQYWAPEIHRAVFGRALSFFQ